MVKLQVMERQTFRFLLIAPGPRPQVHAVAEHLWGKGCDIDSDGDSSSPDARDWTELYVALRPECVEWVDIAPVSGYPRLVLRIKSDRKDLARRVGKFLARHTGGRLQEEPDDLNDRAASPLILNGFTVDARIASLMRRPDWRGKRTSEAWLARFPTHPGEPRKIPFVEFCGPDWAIFENENLRNPDLKDLLGEPDANSPPGDFDPTAGYLIGFTDVADATICVDLRRGDGQIIYDNLCDSKTKYVVAFASIAEFVRFYVTQHGE
jgi:hypothetical protein